MELKDYRQKIDELDREILRLFSERMAVCGAIGKYKSEAGIPVYDEIREKEKLAAVKEAAEEGLAEYSEELFSEIMRLGKAYQNKVSPGKFGLLGEKLGHSFSPQIHGLLGGYEYGLYEVEKEKLGEFMTSCPLAGFNVTIPYKQAVMPYCDSLSDRAGKIGSVNTVVRRADGSLFGDNTDYYGFAYLLGKSGVSCVGKKAIVLGSGGASKTVCAVLKDEGAEVTVISRRGENNYSNIRKNFDAQIIVNTTPLGMYPNNGECAVDLRYFTDCELVLDLVYNPMKTELILTAESLGIPAFGGLWMLVAQAKMASELFTGRKIPDSETERIHGIISRQMQNTALIGMPGCGKTTVGKRLSELTGREFIDVDELIEKQEGVTIPEIFEKQGEEKFRQIETAVLRECSKKSGVILATGGGTVTRPENRRLLRQNSTVVFIDRPLGELPVSGRPVSQQKGTEQIFAERYPLYREWSDVQVENKEPQKTAERIKKELGI